MPLTVKSILREIQKFRDERDWMQFHAPKNLAIAISIEAAELLEHFVWTPEAESPARARTRIKELREEVADIGIYLFELADNLGIDLLEVMQEKLEKNAVKYPVSKSKGNSRKYTEL